MNGHTLTILFEAAQPRLERELKRSDSPAEERLRISDFLDALPQEYQNAAREHGRIVSKDDMNKVRDLLDILQAALGAVSVVVASQPEPESGEPPSPPEGGVIGRIFWRNRTPPEDGWPDRGPKYDPHRSGYRDESSARGTGRDKPRLEVNAIRYLEATRTALEAADRVLEASGPEPEPPPAAPSQAPDWCADPQLLDLVQDLVAARATGNPTMALQRIEQLEGDLRTFHGISTVNYDADSEQTAGWFTILPSAPGASAEFVTRRPALVRGQEVLRRGEVRGPCAGSAAASRPVSAPRAPAPDETDRYDPPRSKEHIDD